MLLNKILIPAALLATVVIAGIFAFMPVEKASTVHGNLATSTSITTLSDSVVSEADNQNRALDFYFNMTHPGGKNKGYNITLVRGEPGKIFTGYATLTAIPNNATANHVNLPMNCGFQTTGQNGEKNGLGFNATAGMTNYTSFTLQVSEGIEVVLVNKTAAGALGNMMGGVCAGTIVLTSWGS